MFCKSAIASGAGCKRAGPMNWKGEARCDSTGSVNTRKPSISNSTVAWPSHRARPDPLHPNFELRLAHFVAEVGLQLPPEGQIAHVGRRVLEPAAVELLRRPHALQHDGAGAAAKHRQLKRCPCDAREYRADRQQRQDYSRWPIHAGSGKRTARIVLIWRRTRSAQMSL